MTGKEAVAQLQGDILLNRLELLPADASDDLDPEDQMTLRLQDITEMLQAMTPSLS